MKMRSLALWITCLLASGAWAEPMLSTPPEVAPPPQVLLAQRSLTMDQMDRDLGREMTLDQLIKEEYDKRAQSMGSAVGLSLLPGGGFGLMYAEKPAQSLVPVLFSIVGYGVAGYYMLGFADTESKKACIHQRDGSVDLAECNYNKVTYDPSLPAGTITSHSEDPRSPGKAYYETVGDYSETVLGEDFEGMKLGLTILAGTYAATTLLGAVWAASSVSDHNERLLKDLQSTTQAPPPQPTIKPVMAYDGDRGVFGVRLSF